MSVASVVTWNLEWCRPSSRAADVVRERLFEHDADIICLTECYSGFLRPSGHVIEAAADYGYPLTEGRRKVLLWSKRPWTEADNVGSTSLPTGRFIRGRTETSIGELEVIGVCIPWSGAHVTTGRRDRRRWQDHIAYLRGLTQLLQSADGHRLVLGDFNQTVPRTNAPAEAYCLLKDGILSRMVLPTAGQIQRLRRPLIDHVAHSRDLVAISVVGIGNEREDGRRLSDHTGVAVKLVRRTHS